MSCCDAQKNDENLTSARLRACLVFGNGLLNEGRHARMRALLGIFRRSELAERQFVPTSESQKFPAHPRAKHSLPARAEEVAEPDEQCVLAAHGATKRSVEELLV